MSSAGANSATTKKFGKGERTVAHSSQKASRFYPAYDESQLRKARKSVKPSKYRESLQPGAVLILLAGRFRGKRVVLLKQLDQGALLVTGPFKVNGVPLRRVNARYVIATSTKIDLSGVDSKTIEKVAKPEYFVREKSSKSEKSEEAFFKQGEKPQPKKPTSARASDQKSIDKPILNAIKKQDMLASYLASNFSLRNGQRPHDMKF